MKGFFLWTRVANWLNVAGMICAVSVLLSFAVLPVNKTHRHYLSVCLVVGIILMQVSLLALYMRFLIN